MSAVFKLVLFVRIYRNLYALFFLTLMIASYRLKKTTFFFVIISCLYKGYGQCIPISTVTEVMTQGVTCPPQWLTYPGGQIKIPFNSIGGVDENKYRFTTVGESTEDTYLALFDSSGNMLAYNDDDPDCLGCLQSTILYHSSVTNIGAYIVLYRKGCQDLMDSVTLRFNVTNSYDPEHFIKEPTVPFYPCKGITVDLDVIVVKPQPNPVPPWIWSSDDPSVASIDQDTGIIQFLKAGVVNIKLKGGPFSCLTIKTYHVKETLTSAISHD